MMHYDLAALSGAFTATAARSARGGAGAGAGRWDEVPSFVAAFGVVFVVDFLFWHFVLHLPAEKAAILSSSTMGAVEGAVVSVLGVQLLREHCGSGAWSALDLELPNTPGQALLTEFFFSYLVADLLLYLSPCIPTELDFILHHIVSGFCAAGVLLNGAGAIGCVLVFWMADITEPLWVAFTISRELRHTSKAAYKVFGYMSPVFTAAFLLVRSVLAPPVVAWVVYTLWFRTRELPPAWHIPMGAGALFGIIGSQLWSYKLVRGYVRYKSRSRQARGRSPGE